MANVEERDLEDSGAIPPIDFTDKIERLREVAVYDLEAPADLDKRLLAATEGLVIDPLLLKEAAAAIRVGHVIIQGPPGTGKSSLARGLAKAYNVSVYPVTAHEDWTTYDVIGRLELRMNDERKEEIVPVNGSLIEAVIHCGNNISEHFDDNSVPQAEWLLIDELNRAHIDKAFGELFTVLGTDELVPINLPHQSVGNKELVIPRRFRIIATLNSYDKQFVQSLSHAIRRRFTFITMDIPPKKSKEVRWQYDLESKIPAIMEYNTVINRAAYRISRRNNGGDTDITSLQAKEMAVQISVDYSQLLGSLFSFVEMVRYAEKDANCPYLPIGTAQLVDTVELFVVRIVQENAVVEDHPKIMDWAVSIKLVPLFESDTVNLTQIISFANELSSPFNNLTKRELLMIASSGAYFVP